LHAAGLSVDVLQKAPPEFLVLVAGQQELGRAEDGGDRGPELVCGVGQEALLVGL
jgi:hypothetical protein